MSGSRLIRIDNLDLPLNHPSITGKRYLYHYTRGAVALDHILPEQRLRLSTYSDLNDPKEAKDWIISLRPPPKDGGALIMSVFREMTERIKARSRVLCFTSDGDDLIREPRDIGDFWEVRGFAHPTMWAHYAENHRGIALVFNRGKLLANAIAELRSKGQLHFGHVRYRLLDDDDAWSAFWFNGAEWASGPASECALRHLERHRQWLFFTKHPDWASEQECRIVAFGDIARYEYISIKDALVEIIFGDLVSPETGIRCCKFGSQLGVCVSTVNWQNGLPYRMIHQHAPGVGDSGSRGC